MENIEKDLAKFLVDQNVEIKSAWLDHIELNEDEALHLESVKNQRVAELSRALVKKTKLKELIEQPLKAQNFHLFFQYFKEWQNLNNSQICNDLSIESKYLDILVEVKNNIVQVPTQVMTKLIKFMSLSLSDAVTLIENSFKLAVMKPNYGQHLSRSHDKDAQSKSSSVNRAVNELLLKSNQAKDVDTNEFTKYAEALRQEFKQ